ncbi:hypothetical protein A2890_02695 [candidate division WWE3 bacterium RIFCSPLOWO2_01_FULL_53_14]|uniref:Uncharacterized protein n=1 Tax=candidate division WWE3 bacterium RIFCSPLOWO2_01_FULL_53_14 TaxID=1802628 RepID=A0A1F4VRH8_UNCKA|nr:MAG: hypothetical protein A2890_02695 [candidate division WWE3 bacterium RIFCSPLOWO2_01_FULL_53_14]
MVTIVNGADLADLKITPLDGGAFFISARCALCVEKISLHLSSDQAEGRSQATVVCSSGGDWPGLFQLCARYSPSETDHPSGVDVWGESYEEDPY